MDFVVVQSISDAAAHTAITGGAGERQSLELGTPTRTHVELGTPTRTSILSAG